MENELNVLFEEYKNAFVNLDVMDKKVELIKELKMIVVMMQQMCEINHIEYALLTSKEALNESLNDDDYLNALFVYINVLKELIGSFSIGIYERH